MYRLRQLDAQVGPCRVVDLRLRKDGEGCFESNQPQVRIKVVGRQVLEPAVDRALGCIAAANSLDSTLGVYLLAGVLDVHHNGCDRDGGILCYCGVIELDVQCRGLMVDAPADLAHRMHDAGDSGAHRKNHAVVTGGGLDENRVDGISWLRTVRRNRGAKADPKDLSGRKPVAAESHRRAEDQREGSQSAAYTGEDSHPELHCSLV